MSNPRQISLNIFLYSFGHHEASWRHPSSQPGANYSARHYQGIAQKAEASKIDAVFFADVPAAGVAEYSAGGQLEPITTLASIAAVTEKIGLIATASTTFYEPYNLARLFSTLDHLSGGRAGWNIVTTGHELVGRNFGFEVFPEVSERYARASEFVDTTKLLWDSWEDDAIVFDKENGRYADASKLHEPNFHGKYINVDGLLTTPRPPQGHPVLIQAGASNDGRAFAAKYAEAIFTAHQRIEDAQAFYNDIKAQAVALGRSEDDVKILPGLSPFVAATEAEAQAKARELNELTIPEYGLGLIRSNLAGQDDSWFTVDNLEERVPLELFADAGDVTNNNRSRLQVIAGIVEREQPTLRELLHKLAGGRGHQVVAGTPEQIADRIQVWAENRAADGFNVMPPLYPAGLDDFLDHVVPILQQRGLFRTEYSGSTLRDHFGLKRPENVHTRNSALV
ncbi:LLM class flavin-dependent oxidoreductase [Populibacterium corticicola]|uniref:LLM class flavin-dependent oxidoreductase n=1 Tax=Populibacterium corticicola TaxID=1812826 RepID=A0ABW5XGZ6_9MICO